MIQKRQYKYDGIKEGEKEEEKIGLNIMSVYCDICGRCERAETNPLEDGKCPSRIEIRMVKGEPAYEVEALYIKEG